MANEIAVKSIKDFLADPGTKQRINDLLKDRASTFIVSLLSTVNTNEDLAECTPKSVFNAALMAAALDLPINQNLGYAYIIPYKDKGVAKAQFQIGAKGFIQLSQRSGQFKTINVSDVREGEMTGRNRLTGDMEFAWIEDDVKRDSLKVIGYVAYMKLINGFEKSFYMTADQMTKHGKKFSQAFKSGYGQWKDDFDKMGLKTVIKLMLSKYAPLSSQMQKAQLADQAIIEGEEDLKYIDSQVVTAQDLAKDKEHQRIVEFIKNSKTVEELKQVEKFATGEELMKLYDQKLSTLTNVK